VLRALEKSAFQTLQKIQSYQIILLLVIKAKQINTLGQNKIKVILMETTRARALSIFLGKI
jgi:hypothetical protein